MTYNTTALFFLCSVSVPFLKGLPFACQALSAASEALSAAFEACQVASEALPNVHET